MSAITLAPLLIAARLARAGYVVYTLEDGRLAVARPEPLPARLVTWGTNSAQDLAMIGCLEASTSFKMRGSGFQQQFDLFEGEPNFPPTPPEEDPDDR